jgi:hypothetical protein
MRLLSLRLLVTASILGGSCHRHSPTEKLIAEVEDLERAYATNDVHAAEAALRNRLQSLSERERRHDRGLNYDMARARVHEKLFLVYRYTGETNKMLREYDESFLSLSNQSARDGTAPPVVVPPDKFAELVERAERNENIRWKTNLPNSASNSTATIYKPSRQ